MRNGDKPRCPECATERRPPAAVQLRRPLHVGRSRRRRRQQELLVVCGLLLCHLPLTTGRSRARAAAARSRGLREVRAAGDAHARRVRRGRPAQRPHVRRRGARLPRRPAGPALRRPGRQAARAAARHHRPHPRAGLHRQRAQVPAAQQPRPQARGDRRLRALPAAPGRAHRAARRLHARQLLDQAAVGQPDRDHPRARHPAAHQHRQRASSTSTRSSTRPPRCTRRPCSRRSSRTFCGCPRCSACRSTMPTETAGLEARDDAPSRRARRCARRAPPESGAVSIRRAAAAGARAARRGPAEQLGLF